MSIFLLLNLVLLELRSASESIVRFFRDLVPKLTRESEAKCKDFSKLKVDELKNFCEREVYN